MEKASETKAEADAAAAEDPVLKIVDDIWEKYDLNKNGFLDKEETKRFCEQTLSEMAPDGKGFSDEDYDWYFKEFDKDGSGFVGREEMAKFVKKLGDL